MYIFYKEKLFDQDRSLEYCSAVKELSSFG